MDLGLIRTVQHAFTAACVGGLLVPYGAYAGPASATGTVQVNVSSPASVTGPSVLQGTTTGGAIDTLDGSLVDFFLDSPPISVFGAPSQAYSVSLPQSASLPTVPGGLIIGGFSHNGGATPALGQFGIGSLSISGEIGSTGLTTAGDQGEGEDNGEGGDENGGSGTTARAPRPILTVNPYLNVVINYN